MGITNRTHAGRKRNRDRTSYESAGRGRERGPVGNGIPETISRFCFSVPRLLVRVLRELGEINGISKW